MTISKVFDLPIAGAGCGDIELRFNGTDLHLMFTDGMRPAGVLQFGDVTAFRFRDEMHSLGFANESYDCLVEVVESDWHKELCRIEPDHLLVTVKESKHFAVLLSSNGYLEVVAKSATLG